MDTAKRSQQLPGADGLLGGAGAAEEQTLSVKGGWPGRQHEEREKRVHGQPKEEAADSNKLCVVKAFKT